MHGLLDPCVMDDYHCIKSKNLWFWTDMTTTLTPSKKKKKIAASIHKITAAKFF